MKVFSAELEKFRTGKMNETEKDSFVYRNRNFFNELVAPFISMAYTLGPVPDLNEPARVTIGTNPQQPPGFLHSVHEALDPTNLVTNRGFRLGSQAVGEIGEIDLAAAGDVRGTLQRFDLIFHQRL